MNAPAHVVDEDAPLDPAIERVRRRMMRLMAVSVGIMLIGLIAVVAAIVYKLSARSGAAVAAGASVERRMALPPGASIVSATLSGQDILFVIDPGRGEKQQYWVYRFGEDRVVARISID
jgi:hypothetical protein